MTRLSQAAGGRSPVDRNPGAGIQLANIAKMILRRNLSQFETDVLMFPRVCGHCSAHLSDGGRSQFLLRELDATSHLAHQV